MNRIAITLLVCLALANLAAVLSLLTRDQAAETLEPLQSKLVAPLAPTELSGFEDLLASIQSSIARVEERIGTLKPRTELDSQRAPLQPVPTSAEIAALTAEITALKQSVAAQLEQLQAASASPPTLAALKAEHPEAKWDKLQALIDLWHVDEERALDDMRLLSASDVISRFGAPTEIWSNDKGLNWVYGQGKDAAGSYQSEVWLCFQNDVVTMVGVK